MSYNYMSRNEYPTLIFTVPVNITIPNTLTPDQARVIVAFQSTQQVQAYYYKWVKTNFTDWITSPNFNFADYVNYTVNFNPNSNFSLYGLYPTTSTDYFIYNNDLTISTIGSNYTVTLSYSLGGIVLNWDPLSNQATSIWQNKWTKVVTCTMPDTYTRQQARSVVALNSTSQLQQCYDTWFESIHNILPGSTGNVSDFISCSNFDFGTYVNYNVTQD